MNDFEVGKYYYENIYHFWSFLIIKEEKRRGAHCFTLPDNKGKIWENQYLFNDFIEIK